MYNLNKKWVITGDITESKDITPNVLYYLIEEDRFAYLNKDDKKYHTLFCSSLSRKNPKEIIIYDSCWSGSRKTKPIRKILKATYPTINDAYLALEEYLGKDINALLKTASEVEERYVGGWDKRLYTVVQMSSTFYYYRDESGNILTLEPRLTAVNSRPMYELCAFNGRVLVKEFNNQICVTAEEVYNILKGARGKHISVLQKLNG